MLIIVYIVISIGKLVTPRAVAFVKSIDQQIKPDPQIIFTPAKLSIPIVELVAICYQSTKALVKLACSFTILGLAIFIENIGVSGYYALGLVRSLTLITIRSI